MAITRNIAVTISGTNGDYSVLFSDATVGREGEHLNTRFTFTMPAEWQMFINTDSVFVIEYLNARGTTGRSINIDFPDVGVIADFNPTYDVPFDALYAPETQFRFEVHTPIDAYTSNILSTETYLASVLNSWDGGKVTNPYGNDIFAYLQSEIDGKVDTVVGKSLVADTAITDLTDGGVTALHQHNADDVIYDNSISGLSATDAQAAIDEIAADVILADGTNSAIDKLVFDTTPASVDALQEGELRWNATDKTLDIGMDGSDIVQQVGLETYYPRCTNNSGSTILNGALVEYNGTPGNSGIIYIKNASTSLSMPQYAMGIATEEILNGATGRVTWFGLVRGIQTNGGNYSETWEDGDIIYNNGVIAGGLSKVKPTAPKAAVMVGVVMNAHASNGTMFVRPTYLDFVSSLSDVSISGVADGHILVWNAANARWQNYAGYTKTQIDSLLANKVNAEVGKGLISTALVTDLSDGGDSTAHYHASDRNTDNHTNGVLNRVYSLVERNKLATIETGAEANNISDSDALELTDGGDTTLHRHNTLYYTKAQVDAADALKVDKVTGYALSKNDFTDAYKTKLDGIEAGAEVNNITDVNATDLTDGGSTTLHNHDTMYYTEAEANARYVQKSTNVTAINDTGIADGEIAVFNLTNKDIRTSDKTIVTTLGTDDTTVPTSKAIVDYSELSNGRYIHFSVDDISTCLSDIKTNQSAYTSIFDNVFLDGLRALHDSYGAVFSLYCYVDSLTSMPTKFQNELKINSSWLKFGIHSNNGSHSFEEALPGDATTAYDNFVSRILTFTGTTNSIDRIPRLHLYSGNLDAIRAMRDCNCGLLGAITSEYEHPTMPFGARESYYLRNIQKTHINSHHKLIDIVNGMVFFPTSIRTDWFASSSDWSVAYPNSSGNIVELIQENDTLSLQGDKLCSLEIFGHEWASGTLSEFQKVCLVAKQLGFGFDFHQNRINWGIKSANITGVIPDNTTTHTHLYGGSGKDTVSITTTFSDLKFVQPRVFAPNTGETLGSGLPGRMSSRYWVLQVSGTEIIGLSSVGATKLNGFTFVEYTALPLSSATVNPSGQKAASWLTSDTSLNSSTRYVMMMGRNIVTDTAFTDSDIAIADTFFEFK
jgi:hypothetical protein